MNKIILFTFLIIVLTTNSGLTAVCEVDSVIVGGQDSPSANYTPNGTGAVERPQPGERDKLGHKHKVGMDDVEVTITGEDDYHHSLTFYQGEVPVVNVRARLKNKTNQKIGKKKVKIKWFESPNKTFNPDHDHHFATDYNRESIGAFKHNSHDDELVERKTNITHLQNLSPGVYYLYPVFYFEGEENIASKHSHGEYSKITILPKYDVEAVSLISDKITVLIGESFTLTAGVFNNRNQLPHDVRVGFYINGEDLNNKLFYAKVLTASELVNQQIITIPVLAPLKPGMYNIAMKVDDEGMLTETNEGNNQRSFNLLVVKKHKKSKKIDITAIIDYILDD